MGGGGVEGAAEGEEVGEGLAGVGGSHERAVLIALDAGEEGSFWGVEPDHEADGAEFGDVGGDGDDAAAGGDDGVLGGGEGVEGGGFAGAEAGFAFGFEDAGDGELGGLGDEVVGVDELEAELAGEEGADGGFAAAHEADEDDVERGWLWGGHGAMLGREGRQHKALPGEGFRGLGRRGGGSSAGGWRRG